MTRLAPAPETASSRQRDLENLVLQFHSVYELVRRTGSFHEQEPILREIVSGVHLELAYERVALWKWDPAVRAFTGVHGMGVPESLVRNLMIPIDRALPLVRASIQEGRVIPVSSGHTKALSAEIYSGLAEEPAECLLLPVLARGQSRCWRIRRDPSGCPKAEAGPEVGDALVLDDEQTQASCLGCPVFPLAGFLWADRGGTGASISEDLLPLWFYLAQTDLHLEAVTLYDELRETATRDPLTGVHNRTHFYKLLELEIERAIRYGHETSLVMIDLDRFKEINDRNGHISGDHVLVRTARVIQSSLRRLDLVARYGGDEFVIMLPHTGSAEALQVIERIRRNLLADTGPGEPEEGKGVQFSAGIAVAPRFAEAAEALVHIADYEMYRAKQSGGNRTGVFGE